MPTVKLDKTVFNKLVGRELSDDELRSRIPMIGTDLESIDGEDITVEVFPNRPDMLSEQGFARAFSSFIGEKTGLRRYDVKSSGDRVKIEASVSEVRPFTACAVIRNIGFDDEKIREIIQVQEKLHVTFGRNRKKLAIGIYPLEKIKLPINYFAADPAKIVFRPLESTEEMTAIQVLSRHPTGREYAHLLEGKKSFPFFADADYNIMSMPPIINSHATGKVSESTKAVFVECSGFDFNTCKICLNILVTALADMGGEIYSMELEYPGYKVVTPDLSPRRMKLDVPYVNKLLGLSLSEQDMSELLKKMGYGFETGFVLVPAYRADILHTADLAEDIAVAYGYERFQPEIPRVSTIGEEAGIEILRRRVAEVLVGLGLVETSTYNLSNAIDQDVKMCVDIPLVELESAVNIDYNVLRAWMVPSLMKVLFDNKSNEYPQGIFESGVCFAHDDSKDTGVVERVKLSVLISSQNADFTRIRQILDALMAALDIKCEFSEVEHGSFIPGRVAKCSVKGTDVCFVGELHPLVLSNWGLEVPISCFELDLSELYKLTR